VIRSRLSASAALWLLAAVVLVASRLLLVPGEPWEQDEALFGAAAFDTDLASRRPHPPGFPLWVAAGAAGRIILGDPVLALQLLSAFASLLTVALLARLWGSALGDGRLGGAAALLYGFAPAVAFHAPRAFTDTPAVCLAAAAAAAWTHPGRRPLLLGTTALAGALLVRPVLAPPLLLLGLAAVALRRDSGRDLALALALLAALLAAGFLPLVLDTGGPAPFARAVLEHGSDHAGALHIAPWRFADLGPVTALGGPVPAVAVLLLAFGWWVAETRLAPRRAGWWLALTLTTAAWLLLAHNRTYPRYSLPLLALLAGPAVGGVARLTRAPRLAVAATALAATAALAWTWPALRAQATLPFPPLAALTAAWTGDAPGFVVVDGGLSPFADLHVLARSAPTPVVWRPLLAEGRVPLDNLPGRWAYVWAEGTPSAFIPGPGSPRGEVRCASPRLRVLSQGRYLTCWTATRGGIVLAPPASAVGRGLRLDEGVRLLLQPSPPGSFFGASVEVTAGPVELELQGGSGGPRTGRLEPGRHPVHVPLERRDDPAGNRPTPVTLRQCGGDGRAVLERVWVDPADGRWTPAVLTAPDQARDRDGLVEGGGLFGVERFGDRQGRWCGPRAWLSVPAGPGRLVVELLAPRPEPARVRLACSEVGFVAEVEVRDHWQDIDIPVDPPLGRVVLHVEVENPFVPAEVIPGSGDHRPLGVVVGSIRFEPANPRAGGGS